MGPREGLQRHSEWTVVRSEACTGWPSCRVLALTHPLKNSVTQAQADSGM